MKFYQSPPWLPGAHLQTIYPSILMRLTKPAYRREIWATPDQDHIAIDWLDGQENKPLVILFHGLEGGSDSHYAITLSQYLLTLGWHIAIVHFRSCGGIDNKLPRSYYAGDTAEINWIIHTFKKRFPTTSIFACGVSLGGNALLKWLGEYENESILVAAASVCAPVDLVATGLWLDRLPQRWLYTDYFLRHLYKKMSRKIQQHELNLDLKILKKIKTLREFDNTITAPMHGFVNAMDYWQRASAKPVLHQITTPTIIINAENDPFIPKYSLPQDHEVSKEVTLLRTKQGGHVGFVSGHWPGQLKWLPETLVQYFQHCLISQER